MASLQMTDQTIVLANALRNAARKSSSEFDILKFFADLDYAKDRIARFSSSGVPELAKLAGKASQAIFNKAASPGASVIEAMSPTAPPLSAYERYRAAKEVMNGVIVDCLGLRSVFFVLKLERCANAQDLAALLPAFHQAIMKYRGEAVATPVAMRVRAMLA